MTDSVVDSKAEVKQATKYVKETENVAEKYSAMTVSKNSSDVNMNVGEMPSAAFTAVPTLKSVKKVRNMMLAITQRHCVTVLWTHVIPVSTPCTAVKYNCAARPRKCPVC